MEIRVHPKTRLTVFDIWRSCNPKKRMPMLTDAEEAVLTDG
jgi:hypothetical protein